MQNVVGRTGRTLWSRAVLLLGLAVIVAVFTWHIRGELAQAHARFERRVASSESLLRQRLRQFNFLLVATDALLQGRHGVTSGEFHRLLAPLQPYRRFPFIRAFGFTTNSPDLHLDGSRPVAHQGPAPSNPLAASAKAAQDFVSAGYWLDEDAQTRAAAARSRDSGVSAVLWLNGDAASAPQGLLLQLVPVYAGGVVPVGVVQRRGRLLGWVTALADVQAMFGDLSDKIAKLGLNIQIRRNDLGQPRVLYSDGRAAVESAADQREVTELSVGDQAWKVEFYASNNTLGDVIEDASLAVATTLALLFTWLFLQRLLDSRERALLKADRLAFRQRRNAARYRSLFESSSAMALLVDPLSRTIVDANPTAADFYGVERAQLRGMKLDAIEVGGEVPQPGHTSLVRHRTATDDTRELEVHTGQVEFEGRRLDFQLLYDVTERHAIEQALRSSEFKYRTIVETTTQGYWLCNAETGRISEVNSAMAQMLGVSEKALRGHMPIEFVDDDSQAKMLAHIRHVFTQGSGQAELILRRADGSQFFAFCNATLFVDTDGKPASIFAFFVDISEQKKVLDDLRIAATFFNHSAEGIAVTDRDNRIVEVNPAFTAITGYSREEVIGKDPGLLSSGRHDETFYHSMWEQLQGDGHWQGEVWNRRRNGEVYPEWLSIFVIHNEQGEVIQHVAVFSDISRHKQDEEIIWRQANFDALTGLPNRDLFIDRVALNLRDAAREKTSVAVMFLDIDRFKWVNETLGHPAGDSLVQQVAERLVSVAEDSGSVARFGGDEFTVLIESVDHFQDLDFMAEDILRSFSRPFLAAGRETYLTASIGIALYPHDGNEVQTLIQNAESAMYGAKDGGRNTFRYFTQDMNDLAQRRVMLEHDLRKAIDSEVIDVFYQPIVDAQRQPVGAEALVRWDHPEFGRISPDEYIPLAEEVGLIAPIEQQVMRAACAAVLSWHDHYDRPLFVSVNVTSSHCRDPKCIEFVDALIAAACLEPSMLKLELTERMMMDDTEQMRDFIERLRGRGVRLAVDDFGTGYSALGYLKRFPIDTLKIDRSFIKDLPEDHDDRALVEAIILMAHSLGIAVVAEGVETEAQFDLLRSLGCDQFQGFLFAHALAPEAFLEFLQ